MENLEQRIRASIEYGSRLRTDVSEDNDRWVISGGGGGGGGECWISRSAPISHPRCILMY